MAGSRPSVASWSRTHRGAIDRGPADADALVVGVHRDPLDAGGAINFRFSGADRTG
jgi:hypothetical protein